MRKYNQKFNKLCDKCRKKFAKGMRKYCDDCDPPQYNHNRKYYKKYMGKLRKRNKNEKT